MKSGAGWWRGGFSRRFDDIRDEDCWASAYTDKPGMNPSTSSAENGLIVANSKNENVRERINRLLVEHNEYNPAGDMTGMLPYSRFVDYKPRVDKP